MGSAPPASQGGTCDYCTMVRLEEGQDLLEYGLLAALIAIAAVGIVGSGRHLNRFFWEAIGASI